MAATAGEKVVAAALSTLGAHEIPDDSNDDGGGFITRATTFYGIHGLPADKKPWCGCAVGLWYHMAGVDDAGVISPATALICERAQGMGGLAPKGLAPPGTLTVKCGTHVGLVVHDRGDGLLDTIEGNISNCVGRRVRDKGDWRLIVPPAVAAEATGEPPTPVMRDSFGFDDLALRPRLFGGWSSAEARDAQMAAYRTAHADHWTQAVRTSAKSPFAFRAGRQGTAGATWRFGGWGAKTTRDAQMVSYAKIHPEAALRAWSRKVPVPAALASEPGEESLV